MDEIVAAWPRHALDISGYDLEQRLPAGQYSAVFLATDRSSNRRVLVRHLAPIDATDAFLPVYRSEISVAARCRSSFVLPFIGFTTRPPYALVFESCRPACVADLLRQGRLAPAQKHGIARAVASALRDIHDGGLVHGDVTAASVVLTDDGAPKLCLNRSSLVESEPSPFAFPGAANYYATERFATGHATKLSDVFSYGVLVWELLNEETPFNRLAAVQIASSAVLRRRLPLAPESPATAIMRGCLAEPQLRWSAAQLIARLESYDSIFPEESQEPGIKLVKEATAKLEGVLGSEYLEWISNLSQDLERAIAFMPICVDLIAQSQNKVICKNAIFALLHLLHKKTELVDKFVELALPDKLLIDKPYLAKEILSLCSIVFTSHPESASPLLIRQGLSFSDICPIKVLEFCAVLCHSFTKDRISWEIIDSLFLNADLYLSLHLGEQLCGLIYLLIVRFSIFCQERSRPVVSFFVKCLKSLNSSLVTQAYRILTALDIRKIPEPAIHLNHSENPETQPALLRYLTIADLTVIPPEVVGHIVIAHETKLAIAVLWRLAKLPKFVPAILANAKSLTAYDPWDAFLLFVVMARHSDAREAVRDCSVLPRILTAVVSAADLQGLSGVASFLHRLPINVTALRKLERSGFIKAFLRRGSSLGDREAYAACHLLADALLRVGLAPSFLEFIPVFAKNLREEPTLERSAVQALVLFSGYRRGRDKLTEYEIVQSVTATELQEGASRALFDKLVENMTRE